MKEYEVWCKHCYTYYKLNKRIQNFKCDNCVKKDIIKTTYNIKVFFKVKKKIKK